MASAAFERFRFSFFEDGNSARDGLDTAALAQLAVEEAARAEDMLIAFLPDSRGVIGLGALRSRRAQPRLAELFEAARPSPPDGGKRVADGFWSSDELVYLAKALWRISPDARWLAAIIEVLARNRDCTQRQIAAEALYDICDPAAAGAFIKALDDPDSQVRYHAARGLLAIHGLPAESKDPEHMMFRLMAKAPARHESGKHDILAAIRGRPIAALRVG
jgi:HEAT repeat protein